LGHRFRTNEIRLRLSEPACNLRNLWRRLVLRARIDTLVADQSPAAPRQDGWAACQHAITGFCWRRVT